MDLFRCESLSLRTHWVLVVMDQFTRRIIGFGIHRGTVDGPSLWIFPTKSAKEEAVVAEIRRAHATGQPVLVGTASVADSERLSCDAGPPGSGRLPSNPACVRCSLKYF